MKIFKFFALAMTLSLATFLGACSAEVTTGDDESPAVEEAPAEEASADEVPAEEAPAEEAE